MQSLIIKHSIQKYSKVSQARNPLNIKDIFGDCSPCALATSAPQKDYAYCSRALDNEIL